MDSLGYCVFSGFRMVCNAKAMETFRFEELELLINGNPVLNFEALKAGVYG